jgi:LPXTG-site transpeptidase (sortase) family protein
VDSDANPATGRTGPYTLASGETNNSVDAGLYQALIIVDKSVSSITFINPTLLRMTYTITIGPEPIPLSQIQATDDLSVTFPGLTLSNILVTPSSNLTANLLYNGTTDFNLLSGTDDLGIGETGTITLSVDIIIPNQTDTYTNTVTASGLPPTGIRIEDSSSATGPLFADPAVTKSGDPAIVYVGENVTFTITVTNNGNQTATDIVVTDPLPVNMSIVSANSTPIGIVTIIPPRTVQVGPFDLDPGNVVTITVVARVNSTGTPPIINRASLTTSSETDLLPNDVSSFTLQVLEPALPETGFAPGKFTQLPDQHAGKTYATYDDLTLSIPSLKVNLPIVGIPASGKSWDVSWLGNRAGWLNGTSFPTWDGNSVLTGHVFLSNGLPGPFINIGKLNYGDQLIVEAFGKKYLYEVRSVRTIKPYEISSVLKHEDRSWITLLTCKDFHEDTGIYGSRTVVRAVLVNVKE